MKNLKIGNKLIKATNYGEIDILNKNYISKFHQVKIDNWGQFDVVIEGQEYMFSSGIDKEIELEKNQAECGQCNLVGDIGDQCQCGMYIQ